MINPVYVIIINSSVQVQHFDFFKITIFELNPLKVIKCMSKLKCYDR